MSPINLPHTLIVSLLAESSSFRDYIAGALIESELRKEVKSAILAHRGSKIAAVRVIRELTCNRIQDLRAAFPEHSFAFTDRGASGLTETLGVADAKYLVESLAPFGHFDNLGQQSW